MELLLALDDVDEAKKLARSLSTVAARRALATEPVADSIAGTRQLWEQAAVERERGDHVAAARLDDRALHAMERLAAERATLDAFQKTGYGATDWNAAVGYTDVTSVKTDQPFTLMWRISHAGDNAVQLWHAFPEGRKFASRSATRIAVEGDGEILLYRDMGLVAQRLPGRWASFSPDGKRLVVLDDKTVRVVDVSTAKTLSTMTVANEIEFVTREVCRWLDDSQLHVSGRCREDSDRCTHIVDITVADILVDRKSTSALLSDSGRYLAVVAPKMVPGAAFAVGMLSIWDGSSRQWRPDVNIGSMAPRPKRIAFGPREQRIIVFDDGLSGLNTYTDHTIAAAVDIRTAKILPPPPLSDVVPDGPWDRWKLLKKSLQHLATAPRALVPSERGPGRSTALAESQDGKTIVLVDGRVKRSWGGVSVHEPHILVVNAKSKKLRKRIEIPVASDGKVLQTTMRLLPDDRTLHLCLAGASVGPYLIDIASGALTETSLPCFYPRLSEDRAMLFDRDIVVDLKTKRTHTLPFADRLELDASAGPREKLAAIRSLPPSQTFCRAGGFVAPAHVCTSRLPEPL